MEPSACLFRPICPIAQAAPLSFWQHHPKNKTGWQVPWKRRGDCSRLLGGTTMCSTAGCLLLFPSRKSSCLVLGRPMASRFQGVWNRQEQPAVLASEGFFVISDHSAIFSFSGHLLAHLSTPQYQQPLIFVFSTVSANMLCDVSVDSTKFQFLFQFPKATAATVPVVAVVAPFRRQFPLLLPSDAASSFLFLPPSILPHSGLPAI